MKTIEYSAKFRKNYKLRIKQNTEVRRSFIDALELFRNGEVEYPLNDHPLSRGMRGMRAFSVTHDIRVVYVEKNDKVTLLDIGAHSQVYK